MSKLTFMQRLHTLQERVVRERETATPAAAREFSICLTALEDAGMRYTRGASLMAIPSPDQLTVAEVIALSEQQEVVDAA